MKTVMGSRLKRDVCQVLLTIVLSLVALTAVAGSCDDSGDETRGGTESEYQPHWGEVEGGLGDLEREGWEEDKFERELNEYEREHGPVGPPH